MIGLANEPSEPATDVIYGRTLEDYVVEDKFRSDFLVACCQAPKLRVSDPFFEDFQLEYSFEAFSKGNHDFFVSFCQ